MKEIEKLKEDIIESYNLSWEGQTDSMGLIQKCKDDFREKVELLIKKIQDYQENGDPVY